ncbi:hypothetical protein IQ07DRAFT_583123 [Pyrenochaeta sp. DS3sAY3a]|nr:hypothetical protein IQ07DRAFT_583123 [Pyrenochaeta sp. DS3sAY3a]
MLDTGSKFGGLQRHLCLGLVTIVHLHAQISSTSNRIRIVSCTIACQSAGDSGVARISRQHIETIRHGQRWMQSDGQHAEEETGYEGVFTLHFRRARVEALCSMKSG